MISVRLVLGSQADQVEANVLYSQSMDWSPVTNGGGKLKDKWMGFSTGCPSHLENLFKTFIRTI